ncbi:MAG: pyrroloquinoline quinone biosynthesis protein PqqE [Candidatus Rokubacteria bacterium]|nr:pyrroloquinoline quinone biosynthesis protein PqqE [Candidatus Rokubacteria bacterium]
MNAVEYRPYTLIAELTYRCPLRCVYCYNPVEYSRHSNELTTEEWLRVFREAEALGVVQLHLTGGEPLARRDVELLVRGAAEVGLYTNLITSGIPLTRDRLRELRDAGLDNVQLSVQDVEAESSDRIAGYRAFRTKLEVARWVKVEGLPLTLNVVLHRSNLDRVDEVVALAERLSADRLELANTQYHGWAFKNRDQLLPTVAQLERAREVAAAARARLQGRMEIAYVTPDYYSEWPKACMDGWGRRFINIVPDGLVLPCHAAHTIAGLTFENARERPLEEIWHRSPSFNLFRGEGWMPEPCRSCPRRSIDFGGCRCQAFHLTGTAAATDPACVLSPDHHLIEAARARAAESGDRPAFVYRGPVPSARPTGS